MRYKINLALQIIPSVPSEQVDKKRLRCEDGRKNREV
jgi:hypothetical protein